MPSMGIFYSYFIASSNAEGARQSFCKGILLKTHNPLKNLVWYILWADTECLQNTAYFL